MNGVVVSIVLTAILAGIAAIPAHFVGQAIQRQKSRAPIIWPFAIALAVGIIQRKSTWAWISARWTVAWSRRAPAPR